MRQRSVKKFLGALSAAVLSVSALAAVQFSGAASSALAAPEGNLSVDPASVLPDTSGYQPVSSRTEEAQGTCNEPIGTLQYESYPDNQHDFHGVTARLKPGTLDTLQVAVWFRSSGDKNYFFTVPQELEVPDDLYIFATYKNKNHVMRDMFFTVGFKEDPRHAQGFDYFSSMIEEGCWANRPQDQLNTLTGPAHGKNDCELTSYLNGLQGGIYPRSRGPLTYDHKRFVDFKYDGGIIGYIAKVPWDSAKGSEKYQLWRDLGGFNIYLGHTYNEMNLYSPYADRTIWERGKVGHYTYDEALKNANLASRYVRAEVDISGFQGTDSDIVFYYETKVKDPYAVYTEKEQVLYEQRANDNRNMFFVARQGKDHERMGGHAKLKFALEYPTKGYVTSFWDSPILDPNLNGVPENELVPKGMSLKGYFVDTGGNLIKGVREQVGDKCITYTDGFIDFSGDNSLEIAQKMPVTKRTYYMPRLSSTSGMRFKLVAYRDDTLRHLAAFEKPSDPALSDRMQEAFLPVTRENGSVVPVKIMYYIDPKSGFALNRTFEVRARPFVLSDYNPRYPLNPVSASPYRDIIRWISFDSNEDIKNSLKPGSVLTREVIPGFLNVKCKVKSITSKNPAARFDLWAPGYYFQDGAAWMIGDNQYIGIHQYNNADENTLEFECWAENLNPNFKTGPLNSPVRGFVVLDAEATDGPPAPGKEGEYLSMRVEGSGASSQYYPLNGYSSCNEMAKQKLAALSPAEADKINVAPGVVKTAEDGSLEFLNPLGRCGERNSSSYTGAIFGPSLMAVAPVDPIKAMSDGHPEQSVVVKMKGLGKQALALGVVLAGDTSNANYNNGMPPVFQYSAFDFNGAANQGTTPDGKYVDWTLPLNYNQNYYYYGSRLGKESRPLTPNSPSLSGRGDNFLVRDGARNDAMEAKMVKVLLGNDPALRTQPKLLPVESPRTSSAYITDVPGKYLAGQDTHTIEITQSGSKLLPVARPKDPLRVKVQCGLSVNHGTLVRGWADFNGNGVFDPNEGSSIAKCKRGTLPRHEDATQRTSNYMPFTETQEVEITFDYPMYHDLNSKQNVWMRLRAVQDDQTIGSIRARGEYPDGFISVSAPDDKSVLELDSRAEIHAYAAPIVRTNPDPDAPAATASALGSFLGNVVGETEDYLFDISGAPKLANDLFCVDKNASRGEFNVLENDENGGRDLDLSTLTFKADQPDVAISEHGRKAVRAGEGTYEVEVVNGQPTGKVIFTPDAEFKQRQKAMQSDSKPFIMRGVTYAIQSLSGDKHYDRPLASSASVRGSLQTVCRAQVTVEFGVNKTTVYQWDLSKKVLAGDDADNSAWVSEEERTLARGQKKVPLTYQLGVTARKAAVWADSIKGTAHVSNFSKSHPAVTRSLTFDVTPDVGITCALDEKIEDYPRQVLLVNKGEEGFFPFTCKPTQKGGKMPAEGFTITPNFDAPPHRAVANIPQSEPNPSLSSSTAVNEVAYIKDSLVVGDAEPVSLDKIPVLGYGSKAAPLSSLVFKAPELIKEHPVSSKEDRGSITLTMQLPEESRPLSPQGDNPVRYANTAQLCDALNTSEDCKSVTVISEEPNSAAEVPAALAVSLIKRDPVVETEVRVWKTGPGGLTEPLSGSEFGLYEDADGEPAAEPAATFTPYREEGDTQEFRFKAPIVQGGTYWLRELKSPPGYELLPEAVKFTVDENDRVTIEKGGAAGAVIAVEGQAKPTIMVSDASQARLPASGGRAVILSLLAGLALVGAAAWYRRQAWRYAELEN